eukprot:5805679-Karenia_brevis.AAC.1
MRTSDARTAPPSSSGSIQIPFLLMGDDAAKRTSPVVTLERVLLELTVRKILHDERTTVTKPAAETCSSDGLAHRNAARRTNPPPAIGTNCFWQAMKGFPSVSTTSPGARRLRTSSVAGSLNSEVEKITVTQAGT